MARNGTVNLQELEAFRQKMEQKLGNNVHSFIEACAKELAARLLAKVIKRTPVGKYPKGSGKKGGTLRRGWTAGKQQDATAYAKSLKIIRSGSKYTIEIINPVEYAPYVEYGHRTRGGKGWVNGKHMLTIPVQQIQQDAPRILENKLKKLLGECFK